MKTFLLLLTLPVLAYSRIEVQITAAEDRSLTKLHISGTSENDMSERDIITFNLTEENLKTAVNAHFGAKPDDVFFKNPTPWGDLYTANNWKPVTRVLKPVNAKILALNYYPYLINSELFNNTVSKSASAMAQIGKTVEETVASVWEKIEEITSEEIKYTFTVKSKSIPGKSTFSYVAKFGENVLNSRSVFVGSETGLMVTLEPNQVILAELIATRGVMKIKLDYQTILSGSVAANYAELFKDHHFWSLDINKVMQAGGLNQTVVSSEVIDFGFFVNSKVDIRDLYTNEVLSSIPLTVF